MSIGVAEMGFQGLDINMGCPVPNVAERGKGSGLILRPEVAAELIDAAKAGGLPVSVKTRIGFTEMAEMEAWITHLLEQDIANLSIHLRTRKEMSKVDAHWEVIPQIMAIRDRVAPQTTITINGDIPDRQKGLELAEQYGVDGIMIGRGFLKILMPLKRTQNTYATRIAGLATFTIGFARQICGIGASLHRWAASLL